MLRGDGFSDSTPCSDYPLIPFGCFFCWFETKSRLLDRGEFGSKDTSDEVEKLCVRVDGLGGFGNRAGVAVV